MKTDSISTFGIPLEELGMQQAEAKAGQYVSGGRNPNIEPTCGTCDHMIADRATSSHGWCPLHNHASVSITGGCDQHQDV